MPDLDLMHAYAEKAQRSAENVLFNSMQIASRIRELYTGPDHVSDWGSFAQADANNIVMEMRNVCKWAVDAKLCILADWANS